MAAPPGSRSAKSQHEASETTQPVLVDSRKAPRYVTDTSYSSRLAWISGNSRAIVSAILLCSLLAIGKFYSFPTRLHTIGTVSIDPRCHTSTFPHPVLLGAQVVSISASPVHNYAEPSTPGSPISSFHPNTTSLSFCNVSIAYTHPGTKDLTTINLWLPRPTHWNSRFLGTGGGGFSASMGSLALSTAIARGYAAASTDAGLLPHPPGSPSFLAIVDPSPWALLSPGNPNLQLLSNYGSRSLHDLAVLGKALTASYYGRAASKAYWSGCSTGGRQGLMLAQRYADDFDGILATAPAINFAKFVPAEYYLQVVMNEIKQWPSKCELEGLTKLAVQACDGLDGVKDGIVADVDGCHFDPETVVGKEVPCDERTVAISAAAVKVAKAAWEGARDHEGQFMWHGLSHEASLLALAGTICEAASGCTAGVPFPIASAWLKYFLLKNSSIDLINTTHKQYTRLFQTSIQEYTSLLSASDPDLSAFREASGKMITWHGLADELIFPNGSRSYYEAVLSRDPSARDYYRYYEAPGVAHCAGGPGAYPGTAWDNGGALDSLVAWVEEGTAPDVLHGVSEPDAEGNMMGRPLCMYPLVARFKRKGADPTLEESFECAKGF